MRSREPPRAEELARDTRYPEKSRRDHTTPGLNTHQLVASSRVDVEAL